MTYTYIASGMGIRAGNQRGRIFMAYEFHIDWDRCKGCGLCVGVCPKNVLEISEEVNTKGYFPVFQARPEDCSFCAMCCVMCPDVAITISKIVEEDKTKQEERSQVYTAA
jgi:2-oxoglutarate ferredoxin oxidoreductase subunit delta